MDYAIHYARLIEAARIRNPQLEDFKYLAGDFHLHHIRPRSWGGSDEICNLVRLTHREHFVSHLLLAHIDPDQWFSVELLSQRTKQPLKRWQRKRIAYRRAYLQRSAARQRRARRAGK